MDAGPKASARRRARAGGTLGAVAVAVVAFLLVPPASGVDTNPPECYSTFGYGVPCGAGLSVGLALACAGVAGLATYLVARRSSRATLRGSTQTL